MRILVVHRAWVEWIINDLFSDREAPRMRGFFLLIGLGFEIDSADEMVFRSVEKYAKCVILG
jgi:hypothetical protein